MCIQYDKSQGNNSNKINKLFQMWYISMIFPQIYTSGQPVRLFIINSFFTYLDLGYIRISQTKYNLIKILYSSKTSSSLRFKKISLLNQMHDLMASMLFSNCKFKLTESFLFFSLCCTILTQYLYLMKKTIILCFVLYACFTLSPGIHKEKHKSTNQCCTSKGGKLCGTIVKDCCKTGCEPGLLNSQWCKDNQQLDPICETCLSTCKKQGGIPCQISANTGRVSCCSLQNCIKAQNSTDDSGIGEKLIGYATSKLIGIALNQHQLADEIIEKFKGPNNYCKEGTEISIGNCMADSFVDLVEAKIMS